jgi:dTMP kinase
MDAALPYPPLPPPHGPAWLERLRGTFLVFEGPDGSGKTTQMRKFKGLLDAAHLPTCEVREPGGTNIGEQIREVLLHTKAEMTLRCEMLLYMASRAQLVEEKIKPALARGEVVLADRFLSSTLAYQGTAGGIPHADIWSVAHAALQGVLPDLVLIFDVDERTAAGRINPLMASATRTTGLDRIESRSAEFHRKVREGYRVQATGGGAAVGGGAQAGHPCVMLDASRSPEVIWADVAGTLERFAHGR